MSLLEYTISVTTCKLQASTIPHLYPILRSVVFEEYNLCCSQSNCCTSDSGTASGKSNRHISDEHTKDEALQVL
jgi:hypothetical protein